MIELTCNTKDLIEALRRVWAPHSRRKKLIHTIQVSMEVYSDSLLFNAIGAISHVPCKRTSSTRYIVSVPLDHLYQVIKTYSTPEINISIADGKITCGTITFGGVSINQLDESEEHIRVDIPINYTDVDLLRLRSKYTEKDIIRNGLYIKLETAEHELSKNISKALKSLKKYGVTHTDIQQLIYHEYINT